MEWKNYKVNLWGTAVAVRSEDSRSAVLCALMRNRIALNTVKVTRETAPKQGETRLPVAVVEAATGKIERFRVQTLEKGV